MGDLLRLLFIGDVVGPAGVAVIQSHVPTLRADLHLDAVIANGENSADNGMGVTAETARALLQQVDIVTLGDHTFDQEGIGPYLDQESRIIRPLNFAKPMPGRGYGSFTVSGTPIGIINLLGSLFMRPEVTSPFAAADLAIQELRTAGVDIIAIDMQAEATSEKQGMGWYLAGRSAAVLGTHTHVPTADLRILPGGTAFVADIGMTGARDGILGFGREAFLTFMATGLRQKTRPAVEGPRGLDAILVEVDVESGQALRAERIYRGDG
jgi:metallophosphoesterase (TIGR00282 family)